MKATGIVRRIDDLGRIVIPREVRQRAFKSKNLRDVEGISMEFFYENDGTIILKPCECLWERNPLNYSEIINPHVTKEGDFSWLQKWSFAHSAEKKLGLYIKRNQ